VILREPRRFGPQLEGAPEALRRLRGGGTIGKVVLEV
jgi:hypothetical protein